MIVQNISEIILIENGISFITADDKAAKTLVSILPILLILDNVNVFFFPWDCQKLKE